MPARVHKRSRRNFLGFGKKTTHSPKLMQEAYDAGRKSADTGQFSKWLAKQSNDIHGSFKRRLEKRYRAGVESMWREEAKVEAKKEAEHKTDVVDEVVKGLMGQGMKASQAKAAAKAAYKAGDSFEDTWRKALKRNPAGAKASALEKRIDTLLDRVRNRERLDAMQREMLKDKHSARYRRLSRQFMKDVRELERLQQQYRHIEGIDNPAKFDRCVADVKASLKKYHRPGNAYAICTAAGTRNPRRMIDAYATRAAALAVATNYPGAKVQRRHGKFEVWVKTGRKRNYQSRVWSGKQGKVTAEVYKTGKSAFDVEFAGPQGLITTIPASSFGGALSIARVKLHELARNPDTLSATDIVPGSQYADVIAKAGHRVYKGVRKSATGLIKTLKKRRKNPIDHALKTYEEFHGIPSEEILEITEQEHVHSVTWTVGVLVNIKVALRIRPVVVEITAPGFTWHSEGTDRHGKEDGYWTFDDATPLVKRVLLTASEVPGPTVVKGKRRGAQLFIQGGDQSISDVALERWGFNERDFHDHMLIGDIVEITYRTRKSFDKAELTDYYHGHGEEGSKGVLPTLLYFPLSQHLKIVGGRYLVPPPDPGLGASPGIVG